MELRRRSPPLWRGQLFVRQIESESKYKDTVRVSQATFRVEPSAAPLLHKNHVYKLTANRRHALVALRGSYASGISMDAITRERLRLDQDRSYHFEFREVGFLGQFLWAWSATDPAYRIATRLGAVSLFLGIVGTALGLWSIYLSLK